MGGEWSSGRRVPGFRAGQAGDHHVDRIETTSAASGLAERLGPRVAWIPVCPRDMHFLCRTATGWTRLQTVSTTGMGEDPTAGTALPSLPPAPPPADGPPTSHGRPVMIPRVPLSTEGDARVCRSALPSSPGTPLGPRRATPLDQPAPPPPNPPRRPLREPHRNHPGTWDRWRPGLKFYQAPARQGFPLCRPICPPRAASSWWRTIP